MGPTSFWSDFSVFFYNVFQIDEVLTVWVYLWKASDRHLYVQWSFIAHIDSRNCRQDGKPSRDQKLYILPNMDAVTRPYESEKKELANWTRQIDVYMSEIRLKTVIWGENLKVLRSILSLSLSIVFCHILKLTVHRSISKQSHSNIGNVTKDTVASKHS